MALKTKVTAEEGRHDLLITREFDLPLPLLFKAYTDPDLLGQWMGTQVLKLETARHGGYQFETRDAAGNITFSAHGVLHELIPDRAITRTFQMDNAPFPAQLEFLEFEALGDAASRLTMQIVYKSVADRDQMLRLPFAQGLNMAHNRLQDTVSTLQ